MAARASAITAVVLMVWLARAHHGALAAPPTAGNPARATWKIPPAPARSPQDEAKTFTVADGFHLELWASEPMVQDPVSLTFDQDGRMWVVEMRGFMPDIDGHGEDQPVGRVSVLEDSDGDGRADKSTVFLDGLVLPRTVAPVRGGALVVHGGKLWLAHDRDGDLRAEGQTLVDPHYVLGGNPEHSANGLQRALDNWYYSAKSDARFRLRDGKWIKDRTEFRGQWGLAQDDFGRLYYNYNYDQLRADVAPPNSIGKNPNYPTTLGVNVQLTADQRVFPGRITTAINRGYRAGILDQHGRLVAFTSASVPLPYRGDAYPPAFRGNVFVLEPAANLVKRNLVAETGLTVTAVPAYEDRDFITSTDERFRPVWQALGPDGAIYLADMYRGIAQHKQFISPYLRQEILSRGLDQHINLGRIWRLVGPGPKRAATRPQLARATDAELVGFLSNDNAWWRDTAQRLLHERNARGAIPALLRLALAASAPPLGRMHALWTIEALRTDRPETLLPAVSDANPRIQIAAIRVVQSLAEGSPALARTLATRLQKLPGTPPIEVELQRALTLGALTRGETGLPTLLDLVARHGADPLIKDAVLSGLAGRELEFLRHALHHPAFAREDANLAPVLQALGSAIVREGKPARVEALLDQAAAQNADTAWRKKPLIAGVVENMVDLETTPVRFARRPKALDILGHTADADAPGLGPVLARALPLLAWPGHAPPPAPQRPIRRRSAESEAIWRTGRDTYVQICAPCHGAKGEGQDPMAPPLVGSEWVTGPPGRLVRIVMFGLEGPVHVRGENYEPPRVMPNMPGVEGFADEILVATLSYVRDSFGRGAGGVPVEIVRHVKDTNLDRTTPFTETELQNITDPTAPGVGKVPR